MKTDAENPSISRRAMDGDIFWFIGCPWDDWEEEDYEVDEIL